MLVKELIEQLLLEDPNMRVVVDGYESGYDEPLKLEYVNIAPNKHNKDTEKDDNWWDGEFVLSSLKTDEKAILLPRKS
jgi:hypothetical protein